MSVEAVDQGLDRGFVEVAQIGSALPRLLAKHEGLWVDETESVNDYLSFDRLDRIDDNGYGARSKLFEGLLSVNIDGGEPAAETGMRVVPAYDGLRSSMCC